jgi:hypothetical protein
MCNYYTHIFLKSQLRDCFDRIRMPSTVVARIHYSPPRLERQGGYKHPPPPTPPPPPTEPFEPMKSQIYKAT